MESLWFVNHGLGLDASWGFVDPVNFDACLLTHPNNPGCCCACCLNSENLRAASLRASSSFAAYRNALAAVTQQKRLHFAAISSGEAIQEM